jgi:hypothetical protein
MIYDQDDDGACAFFEGVAFEEDGFLVLFWWCLVRCYKD